MAETVKVIKIYIHKEAPSKDTNEKRTVIVQQPVNSYIHKEALPPTAWSNPEVQAVMSLLKKKMVRWGTVRDKIEEIYGLAVSKSSVYRQTRRLAEKCQCNGNEPQYKCNIAEKGIQTESEGGLMSTSTRTASAETSTDNNECLLHSLLSSDEADDGTESEGDAGFIEMLSAQLETSSIAVRTENGHYRVYNRTKSSKTGETEYYRCNSCLLINKRKKGHILPKIRMINGKLVGNRNQVHYRDCQTKTEAQIRAKNIDRRQRLAVRSGQEGNTFRAWLQGFKEANELAIGQVTRSSKDNVVMAYPSYTTVQSQLARHRAVARKRAKKAVAASNSQQESSVLETKDSGPASNDSIEN